MSKKYELLNEVKTFSNPDGSMCVLHRIRALRDFESVKKGEKGGYIEKEENLSQEGTCWVYDEAMVFNNAVVSENAKIAGTAIVHMNAQVYGNAVVTDNSFVSDNAKVYGCAILLNDAQVSDNAEVYECAKITNNASIYGNAKVHGEAFITGSTLVFDDANIYGATRLKGIMKVHENAEMNSKEMFSGYLDIGKDAYITNNSDTNGIRRLKHLEKPITFYKNKEKEIIVNLVGFNGNINEFKESYISKIENDDLKRELELLIELMSLTMD